MPKCKKVQRTDYIICAGDMNRRITIYVRDLTPPSSDSVDYEEQFLRPVMVNAMVENVQGETIFSGANIKTNVTHRFTIRYVPGITFENFIDFNGKRFSVIDTINQNERNKFLILRCCDLGSNKLPVTEQE